MRKFVRVFLLIARHSCVQCNSCPILLTGETLHIYSVVLLVLRFQTIFQWSVLFVFSVVLLEVSVFLLATVYYSPLLSVSFAFAFGIGFHFFTVLRCIYRETRTGRSMHSSESMPLLCTCRVSSTRCSVPFVRFFHLRLMPVILQMCVFRMSVEHDSVVLLQQNVPI